MSSSLYWRPLPAHPEGEPLGTQLKYAVAPTLFDHDGSPPSDWVTVDAGFVMFLRDHWTVLSHDESYVVRCDRFDPVTRECLAYDDRPDICSGYPWYGHDPLSRMNRDVRQALPPQCSYTADVLPLLPLIVL